MTTFRAFTASPRRALPAPTALPPHAPSHVKPTGLMQRPATPCNTFSFAPPSPTPVSVAPAPPTARCLRAHQSQSKPTQSPKTPATAPKRGSWLPSPTSRRRNKPSALPGVAISVGGVVDPALPTASPTPSTGSFHKFWPYPMRSRLASNSGQKQRF